MVASMLSAIEFMRRFFHLAFGYQSQTEWVGQTRSRRSRRSGSRKLSIDEFDAASLGPSFTRSRYWSGDGSSGSDTSPDLDDYPRRAYL